MAKETTKRLEMDVAVNVPDEHDDRSVDWHTSSPFLNEPPFGSGPHRKTCPR
jgi:hypothetical protein